MGLKKHYYNKTSRDDGIPAKLFQILKDDAVKVLHSICQQIWKTQQWPQDWRISVLIAVLKKGKAKKCSNYHIIALISHASKIMLKILQARLQQYVSQELPDVQAVFRKGRGTRDQIANIHLIIWKAGDSRKTSTCASLTTLKPLTQSVKYLPAMQETRVWSMCWDEPLEKEMATHSSILARKIPWMKEPGGPQSDVT